MIDNSDDELLAYESIINVYDALPPDEQEEHLIQIVSKALLYKGIILGYLNHSKEAIIAYDAVDKRFGNSSELALQERVADALVGKGVILSTLDRSEDTIAAYDKVIERFGTSSELVLEERVVSAYMSKCFLLDDLNRLDELMTVYDYLIKRFGNSSSSVIQENIALALGNRGFAFLRQAKEAWYQDSVKAKALLLKAQEDTQCSLDKTPGNSIFLGNMGYIEFLLGNSDKASQLMTKAIQIGGKRICKVALQDSQIHPVPQDEAFRQLVDSLGTPKER